ncbi:MAG: hypothetical protein RLZZ283_198, partial [Candidatus Parcubacteria bacterium]
MLLAALYLALTPGLCSTASDACSLFVREGATTV